MSYNSYWYLGLVIFSTILLVYICIRKGTIPSILLTLTLVEYAYLIETVIYIYGGSYEYHPNIVKGGGFYDSNLGAVVSNTFTVPVIAAFIASLQLKWPWLAFFTGVLALVEFLFIKLGIYTLNWWRIGYTSFGLFFVFFPLAKAMYRKLMKPLSGYWHSFFLFLCVAAIIANFQVFPILFLNNRYYSLGLFTDTARDTTAFLSIYYIFIAVLQVILIKNLKKYKKLRYFMMAAALAVINIVLENAEILHSTVWWDKIYYIFMPLLALAVGEHISKLLALGLSRRLKP